MWDKLGDKNMSAFCYVKRDNDNYIFFKTLQRLDIIAYASLRSVRSTDYTGPEMEIVVKWKPCG